MADPTDSYPEEATLGATENGDSDGTGEARLREVLDEHGDDLAAALDRTDEAAAVVETAILVLASAEEDEIATHTDSAGNLVAAADGLTTEAAADLATDVGENGDDLADALETVLQLQRTGQLDALQELATTVADATTPDEVQGLVDIATALSDALSPAEIAALATVFEENSTETVEAIDVLLTLQRQDKLADLVELASTVSALEVDDDAIAGLNATLGAVSDASRDSEPVGPLGFLWGLRSRDARVGLGFLLSVLRAQGARLRE